MYINIITVRLGQHVNSINKSAPGVYITCYGANDD